MKSISEKPHIKEHYTEYSRKSSRILYWLTLLVMTVCNLLLFLVLVPFFLILRNVQLYFLISLIGLIFGVLFNFIVVDIEHLEPRHHLFAAVYIPAISVLNLFVLNFFGNALRNAWELPATASPVYAGILYIAFFMLPYAGTLWMSLRK